MMARTRVEGAAKEAAMADSKKKEDLGTRAVNTMAIMAASFVGRKAITVVWTKVTGKKPPANPEDPGVAFVEALSWSVLVGVTVAAFRLLAIRAVARKALSGADREAANAADG
jgi:Protein of unknown function (DUF4235)